MKKVVFLSLFLGLSMSLMLSPSAAFVHQKFGAHTRSIRRQPALSAKKDAVDETPRNPLYKLLATPNESKPGRSDFFYNDQVVSHLHGYMLLVGLFAAQDEVFLVSFIALASTAAAATYAGALPANPRVPALVAAATFGVTLVCHSPLVHYEAMFEGSFDDNKAPLLEALVCFLNVAWGLWGTWRTKEKVNGATLGF